MRTLVPTGNKASVGLVNTGAGPEASPFRSHIPICGQGGETPTTTFELLPNLQKDAMPNSPFQSFKGVYDIADTEKPCVGTNKNVGMVFNQVKNPNVLPNLAGTYPEPVGGRTKNIGLAHTEGMIKSIGQNPVRQPSNFNYPLKSPLGPLPDRG